MVKFGNYWFVSSNRYKDMFYCLKNVGIIYTEEAILNLFFTSYHILVNLTYMLKMKEFFLDSHPKNLYSLFKKAVKFLPSFLNLTNEVTVS